MVSQSLPVNRSRDEFVSRQRSLQEIVERIRSAARVAACLHQVQQDGGPNRRQGSSTLRREVEA